MPAKKSATKKPPKKAARKATKNPCWPGFQPVPGKRPHSKGSCEPIPGPHSKATRRATQRSAAASKLSKQGKPNPNK
jgi:hypothetical protein